jgi:hypothetical protein
MPERFLGRVPRLREGSGVPLPEGSVQLPTAHRRRGQLPRPVVPAPGKRRLPTQEAEAAAMEVLPDILRYDRSTPASYPNGRKLTDDIYSYRFAWLSHGKIPPTGLQPHNDLLAASPTSAHQTPTSPTSRSALKGWGGSVRDFVGEVVIRPAGTVRPGGEDRQCRKWTVPSRNPWCRWRRRPTVSM